MFILKCGCTNSKLSVLQSSSSIRMCFLASQKSHVPPFCLYSPSSFSLPITIWPIFPGSVQGHLLLESNLWQASLELFFYIITNACYLCLLYLLLSSLCHYLTMLNKIFTDKVKKYRPWSHLNLGSSLYATYQFFDLTHLLIHMWSEYLLIHFNISIECLLCTL